MKIKKLLLLTVFSLFALLLVGCNKTEATTQAPTTTKINDGTTTTVNVVTTEGKDSTTTQGGQTTTKKKTTTTEEEVPFDFMGADFKIMCDNAKNSDPRSVDYTGLYKEEKIAAIEAVEEKYNLNVVYVTFPSEASWGGARERYIIQNSTSGIPTAHVFDVPSYSIGTLAVANAICPLTEYIEKYGAKEYWPEALIYGSCLGEQYGYQNYFATSDEGIFYNIDLLKKYLTKENLEAAGIDLTGIDLSEGDVPSQLWLEGRWTWDVYQKVCGILNQVLPDGYYVMGGTCYNWAYQFLGSNGVHIVNTDLQVEIAEQAAIDTITYLNNLYHTIRWDVDSCELSNATSTEMVKGKVAFHNGQSYWIYQSNKWLDKDFDIGYVPYPVGPNVKDTEGLSDYYSNDVYGKSQIVISSSYSKDRIKPGYENSTLYDEIIFKIWAEMMVFPEVDETTGYFSTEEYLDEYISTRIDKYYGTDASVEAHRSVMQKGYPDYFYSLDEAKGQVEGSYMLMIQAAVKNESGDIRQTLLNIKSLVEAAFIAKYNLPTDFYDEAN